MGQANEERALEKTYISRLHVEVMDLEAVRQSVVRFRISGFDGLQNAVIKLSEPEGGPLTPFECTTIANSLPTTNPTDDLPLVLELLSSGRLTIFKDDRLEKALGNFLILRARTRDSRAGIAQTIPRITQKYADFYETHGSIVGAFIDAQGSNERFVAPITCDANAMRAHKTFLNDLAAFEYLYYFHVEDNRIISEALTGLHNVLDDILGIDHVATE